MIGIDEVGRGSWAGPLLVVAARSCQALPVEFIDSKLLSKRKRELLLDQIIRNCDLGEGWVTAREIDNFGLTRAMQLGVSRALEAINAKTYEEIIIDGSINYCHGSFTQSQAIIKADANYPLVSAASIFAKVKRDRYMAALADEYANYQFEKHVGYGTKLHQQLLEQYGVSSLHRKSYKPIKQLLKNI
ncbi:MAG: ribonuclease HII [Candidatus Saccharimonadales bacterium]